jgi:BTB/POZ domain
MNCGNTLQTTADPQTSSETGAIMPNSIDTPFSEKSNHHSALDPDESNDRSTPSDSSIRLDSQPSPTTDDQGRVMVYIDDIDFVTMHNLLYFLYTGYVNLHHDPDSVQSDLRNPDGYPDVVDAFSMYRAANMYLLEELEDRCYRYLVLTCSPENICERLFGNPACIHYDKIRNSLLEYVAKNYDTIKMSKEWEDMLLDLKNCSQELVAYRSKILLDVSKLTCGGK